MSSRQPLAMLILHAKLNGRATLSDKAVKWNSFSFAFGAKQNVVALMSNVISNSRVPTTGKINPMFNERCF